MALVNISSALKSTLQLLEKTETATGVGLYSYKRNRRICVVKTDGNNYLFSEDGYHVEQRTVNRDTLARELRNAIKREFPRSRKVRLYKLSSPDEIDKQYPAM